jgi:dTDP-glucose pyrophosphorylase
MKALILAAGRGRRLGEMSNEKNKCMLIVKGKPLLEYSLDCAVRTEVSEIIIVVGYKAEDITYRYKNAFKGKPIQYVRQSEQKGLVHAIECARESIGKDDFMLMLGDELLIKPDHQQMIVFFKKENLFGLCGVVIVDDINMIKKTYSIIQTDDNKILRLIEKPTRPMNNIMGTGNCIFKNDILSYISRTPINQNRQEKELPDLIQCAIDEGHIVKSFRLCEKYINVNSNEEIENLHSYFAHL